MRSSKLKIKATSQKRSSRNFTKPLLGPMQSIKPFQIVKELASDFDLSTKDMASVLDITSKTFSRWKIKSNAMSEQQADRMVILKSIFDLGRKVLGSNESVKKWIREPIFSLDGQIPIKLLKTESGRRKIESVLHQIEFGFF
jgi:putative toxin-antitoxin system antitoxin component (TIGR02293 family)